MLTITIVDKEGVQNVQEFDQNAISIGRIQDNDIVLPKSNISKRHARIVINGQSVVIIDAKSTNGTYVNGHRIDAPTELGDGDSIYIGDFSMNLAIESEQKTAPRAAAPLDPEEKSTGFLEDGAWGDDDLNQDWNDQWSDEPSEASEVKPSSPQDHASIEAQDHDLFAASAAPKTSHEEEEPRVEAEEPQPKAEEDFPKPEAAQKREASSKSKKETPQAVEPNQQDVFAKLAQSVHTKLIEDLRAQNRSQHPLDHEALLLRVQSAATQVIDAHLSQRHNTLPQGMDADSTIAALVGDAAELGPLEPLFAHDAVRQITVCGPNNIFVRDTHNRIRKLERGFKDEAQLYLVAQRLAFRAGCLCDSTKPLVDASLADGAQLQVILPPLAHNGIGIGIRKPSPTASLKDFVAQNVLTAPMAELLQLLVQAKCNILIGGNADPTPLLMAMAHKIAPSEGIISIEDHRPINLRHPQTLRLKTSLGDPQNPNDTGIGIQTLVQHAQRMLGQWLLVGPTSQTCSAQALLSAMHTHPGGVMHAIVANDAQDSVQRFQTQAALGHAAQTAALISESIDWVVYLNETPQGSLHIAQIAEVAACSPEDGAPVLKEVFVAKVAPKNKDNIEFEAASDGPPAFFTKLNTLKISIPETLSSLFE